MPPYLTNVGVLKSLWPILLIVFILALAISFFAGRRGHRRDLFIVVLSFSMLGIVTGYLTGFSREPAIGTVIPGVLSLMGGLVVFILGKDTPNRLIVLMSLFAFSLALIIGAEWGSVMREEYKNSADSLKNRAFIEFQVNKFRKNMDLPPLPPEAYLDKK